MAKLLKHFGLGYGNSKKSETFDYRAKTLPASATGRGSARGAADTSKSTGRRNTGASMQTVECGDATSSSHSSRRASHDTFLTIPARGLSGRSERDWSLRGTKHRETLPHAAAFSRQREAETMGSKKRCNLDAKDLRRCVTTDDITCRDASTVTPAVYIY